MFHRTDTNTHQMCAPSCSILDIRALCLVWSWILLYCLASALLSAPSPCWGCDLLVSPYAHTCCHDLGLQHSLMPGSSPLSASPLVVRNSRVMSRLCRWRLCLALQPGLTPLNYIYNPGQRGCKREVLHHQSSCPP
jgi:hypothetical protein